MSLLECHSLTYFYPNSAKNSSPALSSVSLNIEKGDFLAVIGHTGSGKSTLIQHFNGLLRPTKGEVCFKGQNIWKNKSSIRAVRFQIGLCFQYPEHQLFDETVEKDIAFGPRNMGLSSDEVNQRVFRASQIVDLPNSLLKKSPFELSGGEKRRVAIAGVIAMDPEILIFDEPTAGLDPVGREQILALLLRYHEDFGKTILLISHNMDEVASVAKKVLVMHRGQVVSHELVSEFFSRSESSKFLSIPTATRIFRELAARGLPCRTEIFSFSEALSELVRLRKEGCFI